MTSVEPTTASLTKPTVTTSTRSILLTSFLGLAALFAFLLLLVAFVTPLPWWVSLVLAAGFAGGIIFWRRQEAGHALIKSVGAVESTANGVEARLVNLLEGLALTGGISESRIYTVHDDALNAAALECDGESHILATTGLVENLSRIELEGVIAELVARIKSGDAEVTTLASSMYGPLVTGPLAPVTKPLGLRLINRVYVSDRELLSDGSAVILTRYPPGLLSALEKIKSSSSQVPGAIPAYDAAWFVSPRSEAGDDEVVYNQDSDVNLRIDVLAEL